jgi:hypothetical protein
MAQRSIFSVLLKACTSFFAGWIMFPVATWIDQKCSNLVIESAAIVTVTKQIIAPLY